MAYLDDLDMSVGDPIRDLRTTLSCFDSSALRRLGDAFSQNLVITKKYSVPTGQGCLLFWLTDRKVASKPQLLSWDFGVVPDGLMAARRVVRYWDWTALTPDVVQAELKDALAVREEAAAAEDAAIDRAAIREASPVAVV